MASIPIYIRRPIVLLALAGALLVSGTRPAAAIATPLVTGVSGMQNEDGPIAFQHVEGAGARFVGRTLAWYAVAPATEPSDWQPGDPADPNYDWTSVDNWVTGAVQAGLTPVLVVYGAPSWAQRCQAKDALVCDPDPAMLADFARAAARRYSGHFQGLPRVRFWQGMNEPNLNLFFSPQFRKGKPASPALYRTLLNEFYSAVKSVDRSNVVLAAGLAPFGTLRPMRFARLLLCMAGRRHPHPTRGNCGGGVHFDVFDIHPYTTGGPTHRSSGADVVQLGDLSKLQQLLSAADKAGRIRGQHKHTPLWITEFAWASKPPDPAGLAMAIAARWTSEALFRAWRAGVSHFFWYLLRDDPPNGFSQGGLYFRGATLAKDRPKKLMYAFRFPFVAFKRGHGFFFWGRTPNSNGGAVRIEIRTKRGWHKVARTSANRSGIFDGVVGGRGGVGPRTLVRARYRGENAVPFSLHDVKDFYQPPWGSSAPHAQSAVSPSR